MADPHVSDIMVVVFRVPGGTRPPTSADAAVALMRAEAEPQIITLRREAVDGLASAAIGQFIQKAARRLDEGDRV